MSDFSIIINVLEHLLKEIVDRTIQMGDKKVGDVFDIVENKIDTVVKEYITEKNEYKFENDINKVRRFILESCDGEDNIAFIKKYKAGYQFVFFDFDKVKYYYMKNFNCRVFISDKRSSMILLPNDNDLLGNLLPMN